MRPSTFFLFLVTAVTTLSATPIDPASPAATILSHQLQLPHTTLTLGNQSLETRIAADPLSRELGLMKQKTIDQDEGMLFVYPRAQQVAFWMKETPLRLSIAYINGLGRIVEIHDLEPFNEHSIVSSSSNILYALEVKQGWFSKNQILPGDTIRDLPSALSAK